MKGWGGLCLFLFEIGVPESVQSSLGSLGMKQGVSDFSSCGGECVCSAGGKKQNTDVLKAQMSVRL